MNKYDIIIIGGGHAGCEAALASARTGCKCALITMHKDTIALMSCNPAIGGVGKGQLVKEIDALGGEMARATDSCGIQFRVLNKSKGPAVWSSRAQVDMEKYKRYMQKIITYQKNLEILETKVLNLISKNRTIKGIETDRHEQIFAKVVVLTPGTFLNGLIHVGMKSFPGGRIEEQQASKRLSESLKDLGFNMLRFKTGTCARLNGKTIDFSKCEIQHGDDPPRPFSVYTNKLDIKQVPCYITYTNKRTHEIINNNLERSPLFSGKITGTGVRYCPSLEDKVVKFPHHERHQIFLEPEGLDTDEYYPSGLSTSLPEDVQSDFIHSIPGLERAKINRFGYGIEHDVVDPTQCFPTLESKHVKNLYLAGQINGTTGYEEAAAQGLVAGINAALKTKGKPELILDRSNSYIGVLIDDLITKGTNEPYRMLTSRVEYRLTIREDNADLRLRELGFNIGLVTKEEHIKTQSKQKSIDEAMKHLKEKRITNNGKNVTLFQFLKRPEVKVDDIVNDIPACYPPDVLNQIEIETKYSGFIKRQLSEVSSFRNLEKIKIPKTMNYDKVGALSLEIKEKLSEARPVNLGQASRISGITPAAVSILMVYLKKIKSSKS